jgi:hypothetical protein
MNVHSSNNDESRIAFFVCIIVAMSIVMIIVTK